MLFHVLVNLYISWGKFRYYVHLTGEETGMEKWSTLSKLPFFRVAGLVGVPACTLIAAFQGTCLLLPGLLFALWLIDTFLMYWQKSCHVLVSVHYYGSGQGNLTSWCSCVLRWEWLAGNGICHILWIVLTFLSWWGVLVSESWSPWIGVL